MTLTSRFREAVANRESDARTSELQRPQIRVISNPKMTLRFKAISFVIDLKIAIKRSMMLYEMKLTL